MGGVRRLTMVRRMARSPGRSGNQRRDWASGSLRRAKTKPLCHRRADVWKRRRGRWGRGRTGSIRANRQHLVLAFGEEQVEGLLSIGGALLRLEPDVVGQLLDVDERSERVLDERDAI